MPVITVEWWKGNDRDRREELVAEVTSTVSRIAQCPTEAVTVIIRDVEPGHWGRAGQLADTPQQPHATHDTPQQPAPGAGSRRP